MASGSTQIVQYQTIEGRPATPYKRKRLRRPEIDVLPSAEHQKLELQPQLNVERRGCFIGVPDVSQRGLHPVLVYRIPGEQLSYSFALQRTNRASKVYRCIGCKLRNAYTKIVVVEDVEFETDPCSLPHVCLPLRWTSEKCKRTLYEKCQDLRNDSSYAVAVPKEEYLKLLRDVNTNTDLTEEEKEGIVENLHNYSKLRKTFSRSINSHGDRAISMVNIPDVLSASLNDSEALQD